MEQVSGEKTKAQEELGGESRFGGKVRSGPGKGRGLRPKLKTSARPRGGRKKESGEEGSGGIPLGRASPAGALWLWLCRLQKVLTKSERSKGGEDSCFSCLVKGVGNVGHIVNPLRSWNRYRYRYWADLGDLRFEKSETRLPVHMAAGHTVCTCNHAHSVGFLKSACLIVEQELDRSAHHST